jgi:predicted nucleic acid-binding protein
MKTLLDTCVISELVARQPNPKVVAFVDSLDPEDAFLSAVTIGEIVKGIELLPASRRKADLLAWLREDLLVRFAEKIVALVKEVLMEWGAFTARLESVGKSMPAIDSLIAASARTYKMRLVTRKVADFEDADVEIVNPWD